MWPSSGRGASSAYPYNGAQRSGKTTIEERPCILKIWCLVAFCELVIACLQQLHGRFTSAEFKPEAGKITRRAQFPRVGFLVACNLQTIDKQSFHFIEPRVPDRRKQPSLDAQHLGDCPAFVRLG